MNANEKKWYVGAMNDGLFVIDAPPRPSTDDITNQPGVNVIADLGTNRHAADLLVAEHNKRIETLKEVRELINTVNPRLTLGSANGSVMNQVTFESSSLAAPDNATCSKCGGTKPTCCRCPDDPAPSASKFVQEFTMAAIEAHVGYQHQAKWHDCNYAKCAERREMIDALNAITLQPLASPSDAARRAAESVYREMFKLGGLDHESVIGGIAAIISKHFAATAADNDAQSLRNEAKKDG